MSLQSFNTTLSKRPQNIDFRVKVVDVNREFLLRLPEKTRIKEVGNKLAELLNLSTLRTDFAFMNKLGLVNLNPSSTLYQNGLRSGDALVAKIINTGYNEIKMSTFYKSTTKVKSFGNSPVETYIDESRIPDYGLKGPTYMIGLRLVGICNNPKCVTSGKKVTYPMGMGEFNLIALISKTSCLRCKRSVQMNGLSLSNCYWKVEGNYASSNGFVGMKYMKSWMKTEGTDNTVIYDKLRETKYLNPKLMTKSF